MDARLAPDPLPAARVERDARLALAARLAGDGPWLELRASGGPAAWLPAPPGAAAVVESPDFGSGLEDVPVGAVVTAFETIEWLPAFAGLVEQLVELSAARSVTVLLAVPDDAYAPVADGRPTVWTEGALAELRSLLPAGAVLLAEVPVRGVAIVPEGAALDLDAAVRVDPGAVAASGWLLAFGPRAGELESVLCAVPADLRDERRAWRAAQAELAVLRARST